MDWHQLSDDDITAIISPLINSCLEGSTTRDHAKHVADFTQRLKVIVTEENLSRQCEAYQEELGYFKEWHLVALFRRTHSLAATWRLSFTKTHDEYVLEANFVYRDGRLQIDHCMIF